MLLFREKHVKILKGFNTPPPLRFVCSLSLGPLVCFCLFVMFPVGTRFSPLSSQTFKFEEVQTLRFEVYDVDTAYKSADATHIDLAKQVCHSRTNISVSLGGGGVQVRKWDTVCVEIYTYNTLSVPFYLSTSHRT